MLVISSILQWRIDCYGGQKEFGRSSSVKALSLIKAFAEALRFQPDLQLLMVGEGDETDRANELVKKEKHSYPVDIWAFGVVIYEALVKSTPFDGDSHKEIYKNI